MPARALVANNRGVQELKGEDGADNPKGHPHPQVGEVSSGGAAQISYLILFTVNGWMWVISVPAMIMQR
jgi:hypothetical protein